MTTSHGSRLARLLSPLAVLTVVAGTLAGLSVDGARAESPAITVTYAPAGIVEAGQQIQVTATGFPAYAPIMIGQCPAGRAPHGPGDCGPSERNASVLTQSDAEGVARATLTAVVGPMHNATAPAVFCSAVQRCDVVALNIMNYLVEIGRAPLQISPDLVAPEITVEASRAVVKRGKKVTFSGVIGPNQALREASLQRKVKGVWRTSKRTQLSMTSQYSVTVRPKAKKVRKWRVALPATSYSAAAVSKAQTVKVKVPKKKAKKKASGFKASA
jgi:hypothetical protein